MQSGPQRRHVYLWTWKVRETMMLAGSWKLRREAKVHHVAQKHKANHSNTPKDPSNPNDNRTSPTTKLNRYMSTCIFSPLAACLPERAPLASARSQCACPTANQPTICPPAGPPTWAIGARRACRKHESVANAPRLPTAQGSAVSIAQAQRWTSDARCAAAHSRKRSRRTPAATATAPLRPVSGKMHSRTPSHA